MGFMWSSRRIDDLILSPGTNALKNDVRMVSSVMMYLKRPSYVPIPKIMEERGTVVISCLFSGTRGDWIMDVCILSTQEQTDTR
jgi:hypothetical protein